MGTDSFTAGVDGDIAVDQHIHGVAGPRRVFVTVPAVFVASTTLPPLQFNDIFLEWRLLDAETNAEVEFSYRGAAAPTDAAYGRFRLYVPSAPAGLPRRLVLQVSLGGRVSDDPFFRPARYAIELTNYRIIAFPASSRVPIYTVRSFHPDVPGWRDTPSQLRIKRVVWSAIAHGGVARETIAGPTHTVSASARSYPDLGWAAPAWTDGTYGESEPFNRPGTYEVLCRIEFADIDPFELRYAFEAVYHTKLPDLDIVDRAELPALVGEPTTLEVDSDPRLCSDLPVLPESLARLGVDFSWDVAEIGDSSVTDCATWNWQVLKRRPSPYRHLDPSLQRVTTPPWERPGTYAVRCVVRFDQAPLAEPIAEDRQRTIIHLITVIDRADVLPLAAAIEKRRALPLRLYMKTLRLKADQLAERYPGAKIATSAEAVHTRLTSRIHEYFPQARDPIESRDWRVIIADTLPGVFVPRAPARAYPMRLYWHTLKHDPLGVVMLDAVGEEIREQLGVSESGVYTLERDEVPSGFPSLEDLVNHFIDNQGSAGGDYPRGWFHILDRERSIDTGTRRLVDAVDKVASYAGLVGMALLLVPDPGLTKIVGTVLVVPAGLYGALRSGQNLAGDLERHSAELGETETWYDVTNIAMGLVMFGEAGLQLRSGFHALRPGDSMRLLNSPIGEVMQPTTLSRGLAAANTAGDLSGVLLIAADVLLEIEAVILSDLSVEEKWQRIVALVLDGLAQANIALVSSVRAVPFRALWRRAWWNPPVEIGGRRRTEWRAEVAGHTRVVLAAPHPIGERREFKEFCERLVPSLRVAYKSGQLQEAAGIFAHVSHAIDAGCDDFVFFGGAGRLDTIYFDPNAPPGRPRLIVHEGKGSANAEAYVAEDVASQRTIDGAEVTAPQGSPAYLQFPVRSAPRTPRPAPARGRKAKPRKTVLENMISALEDTLKGKDRGVTTLAENSEPVLRRMLERLRALQRGGVSDNDYELRFSFATPDPQMSREQIDTLIEDTAHRFSYVYFHPVPADLIIAPALLRQYLREGYYQILKITNIVLAREAYLTLGGAPDADETPLTDDERRRLEALRRQIVDAVADGFTEADVEALLPALAAVEAEPVRAIVDRLAAASASANIE